MRTTTVVLNILLGTSHKECCSLVERIEPREGDVATVQQVKRARFEDHSVEQVDIVNLSCGHVNIDRDAAARVQQRMEPDRACALAKLRRWERCKAQVDGAGIEGIDGI